MVRAKPKPPPEPEPNTVVTRNGTRIRVGTLLSEDLVPQVVLAVHRVWENPTADPETRQIYLRPEHIRQLLDLIAQETVKGQEMAARA